MTDVNAQFKAERIQQIADIRAGRDSAVASAEKVRADFSQRLAEGKVKDLGNGKYRVTDPDSWDNNEVWSMQTVPEIGQLVLPETRLDESTGHVALYTREATWHGTEEIGSLVPEGISDLQEVLKLAHTDFEVLQSPALYRNPRAAMEAQVIPEAFVNVRSDTGAALGVVGKVYKPIQNYDAGAFLQELVQRYGLLFQSAGATYGGRHVFIGMQLPDDIVLDLAGAEAVIKQKLYFLNSHDGTTAASVTVSPWNVTCGNTEVFNLRDAIARWSTRHTTNAMRDDRLAEAQRTLGLTGKYFRQFKIEEEALARTDLALSEFAAVAADIYPKPDGDKPGFTARKLRFWDDRFGTLLEMYSKQADETGRTAYSAERVYTDYLDHVAPKRVKEDKMAAARATAIVEADDLGIKNRVHARLLTLTNR